MTMQARYTSLTLSISSLLSSSTRPIFSPPLALSLSYSLQIDQTRIYLTGFSAGGGGVWAYAGSVRIFIYSFIPLFSYSV
jgi:hypothetical protein